MIARIRMEEKSTMIMISGFSAWGEYIYIYILLIGISCQIRVPNMFTINFTGINTDIFILL